MGMISMKCDCCGATYEYDDWYVIMKPFPHFVCKACHNMIPLF